jgi:hypothetical protein
VASLRGWPKWLVLLHEAREDPLQKVIMGERERQRPTCFGDLLSQSEVAASGLILSSPTCSNGTNGIARKHYLGNIKTLLFID